MASMYSVKKWGSVVGGKLWGRVFDQWERVQRRYWQDVDDLGWWSGERANVSLFGHAIWQAGGYSLQEYSEEKEGGRGRPDMYARLGRHDFMIEAKQCWPRLHGKWQQRIDGSFEQAILAAKRNNRAHGARTAMTFASYVVPVGRTSDVNERIRHVVGTSLLAQKQTSAGIRVDLFPHGRWTRKKRTARDAFDVVRHTGWPQSEPERHFVGLTVLVGFP